MANNLTENMRSSLDTLRESNEQVNEDNWWADKAKKLGGKIAGKFSVGQKQKLENRQRATELVNAYKEAIASGLPTTYRDLINWMKKMPNAQPAVIKAAMDKMNPKPKGEITVSQVRDFMIHHTSAEKIGIAGAKDRENAKQPPKSKAPSGRGDALDDTELAQIRKLLAQMSDR